MRVVLEIRALGSVVKLYNLVAGCIWEEGPEGSRLGAVGTLAWGSPSGCPWKLGFLGSSGWASVPDQLEDFAYLDPWRIHRFQRPGGA